MSLGSLAGQQPNWQGNSVTPDQIRGYFSSRGVTPFDSTPDYWASKWGGLQQRGAELGNPNYAFQRLQAADEFLPGQDPRNSPYYEAPQQQSMSGSRSGYTAQGIQAPATTQNVAPTWTAILGNQSAYGNGKQSTALTPFGGDPQRMTLAQLAGTGR